MRTALLFIVLTISLPRELPAQCPGSYTCEAAQALCALNALNGFTCTTTSFSNPNFPLPSLCFGTGTPTNLQWWAFVGEGGPVFITFNFDIGNCNLGEGIAAGVLESGCDGNAIWDCNANCNSSNFTLSGTTEACKLYHIWVDGCDSDICTFTMSVSGSTGAPTLPPLPPLTTRDRVCPGGRFEVCAPSLGDCEPTYEWTVDGVIQGRGSCILVNVPENAPSGQNITVCYTATIGNPDNPSAICDQGQRCTQFVVEPADVHLGSCRVICFEDQPYVWNGEVLTGSCINPPCSARVQLVDCAVDSLRSFILLPPPAIGQKDTLICDSTVTFQAENRKSYSGSVCEELIEFSRQIFSPICPSSFSRCDTSYILNIARPTYTTDWELDCSACSGEVTINANLELDNNCLAFFGRLQSQLLWTNDNGDTLGITQGNGNIIVTQPGLYCAEVEVTLDGQLSCILPVPECIDVPEALFPDSATIDGPDRLCRDSIATYTTSLSPDICDVAWQVSDNGTIINDTIINDSAFVTISWDTSIQDTGRVCIDLKSDCGITTSCFLTKICPISTETYSTYDEPINLWVFDRTLYWKSQDNKEFSIHVIDVNGRIVKTIKTNSSSSAALGDLPSGVYLIGYKTGDQNQFHYDTFILP